MEAAGQVGDQIRYRLHLIIAHHTIQTFQRIKQEMRIDLIAESPHLHTVFLNLQLVLLIDHLFFLLDAFADALRHSVICIGNGGKLARARRRKLFTVVFQRIHLPAQLTDGKENGLKDQDDGKRQHDCCQRNKSQRLFFPETAVVNQRFTRHQIQQFHFRFVQQRTLTAVIAHAVERYALFLRSKQHIQLFLVERTG